MHIELVDFNPTLVDGPAGFVMRDCEIRFDTDSNNQLVLGNGRAKISLKNPAGPITWHWVQWKDSKAST